MKYYNLDGIKEMLEKEISQCETLLNAWKAVTFPTKKNGEPFKAMQKNICGATYVTKSYAMQSCQKELYITAQSELCGYVSDSVDAYMILRYIPEGDERLQKAENIQPKTHLLSQVYLYDVEDIKCAVSERIAYLENRADSLKWQLDNADAVYNQFLKAFADAYNNLANASRKKDDSTLFHAILDTVKERYPYC